MAAVVLVLSLALLLIVLNGAADANSEHCKNVEDKSSIVCGIPSSSGSCSCGFTLNSGCFLDENKPSNQACQCCPSGSIDCPYTLCVGRLVPCIDPNSAACKAQGKSEANCLQGVQTPYGNCNGYTNDDVETTTLQNTEYSNCKYWCRNSKDNVFYCCENDKQGECPPGRGLFSCNPFKTSEEPTVCDNDLECFANDKCCYDTCLQVKVCKAPHNGK